MIFIVHSLTVQSNPLRATEFTIIACDNDSTTSSSAVSLSDALTSGGKSYPITEKWRIRLSMRLVYPSAAGFCTLVCLFEQRKKMSNQACADLTPTSFRSTIHVEACDAAPSQLCE